MRQENQVQEIVYKADNHIFIPGGFSFRDTVQSFITYQHAFIISQQISKKALLDQGTRLLKRGFDILFSFAVIIIGLPVFILLALITQFTSPGPVFYRQERMGKDGNPFYIYKFRSMRTDAEKAGPQLASENDPRVTPWGRFMRKTRLDELPQFWNVLKGDMSVVGPRPERQHFINKIVQRAPEYNRLLRVKPGITSIGQICYGYAENVEQMCERMLFDLSYLSNVNLKTDLSIIFRTVRVMLEGRGK